MSYLRILPALGARIAPKLAKLLRTFFGVNIADCSAVASASDCFEEDPTLLRAQVRNRVTVDVI
jgi:hypothetical protein